MVRVTIQHNEIKVKKMRRSLSSGGGGVGSFLCGNKGYKSQWGLPNSYSDNLTGYTEEMVWCGEKCTACLSFRRGQ